MPHNGAAAIEYPYRFVAPSNTGIPSGFDLNNNGAIGGPDDAFGFGFFPGQFGMAVYSMYPIDVDDVRTFQLFRWADMPGALLPDDPATPAPADWYSPAELEVFRLSSKSHWDLPIDVDGRTVHFLVSHPTPPVFDGPEDRNGTRNFDEIRFWADYVTPGPTSAYIYDDEGGRGGLARGRPVRHRRRPELRPPRRRQHPRRHPAAHRASAGEHVGDAGERGRRRRPERQGGINLEHRSDPALRHRRLRRQPAPGTCAPTTCCRRGHCGSSTAPCSGRSQADPLFRLVGDFPFPSSDHRLVWVDVAVPGGPPQ